MSTAPSSGLSQSGAATAPLGLPAFGLGASQPAVSQGSATSAGFGAFGAPTGLSAAAATSSSSGDNNGVECGCWGLGTSHLAVAKTQVRMPCVLIYVVV